MGYTVTFGNDGRISQIQADGDLTITTPTGSYQFTCSAVGAKRVMVGGIPYKRENLEYLMFIKHVRTLTGAGLGEAKAMVDSSLTGQAFFIPIEKVYSSTEDFMGFLNRNKIPYKIV